MYFIGISSFRGILYKVWSYIIKGMRIFKMSGVSFWVGHIWFWRGFLKLFSPLPKNLSDNFSKVWPSVSFFSLSILIFYFLTRATQTIPLGTSYVVWTGIGALGTVVVGIVFFMGPVMASRIFFLLMLISSIIGLKLVTN